MSKKVKYVHIMSHHSIVFNKQIVYMINENTNCFNRDEHLFVISNEVVYQQVKEYENVIFEKDISINKKKIKKYAEMCNYIFLHSNTLSTKVLVLLNKKILNKIIWCEWGHDLYDRKEIEKHKIRSKFKSISKFIKKEKTKKFHAIGIGFRYDVIEAKRKYGKDMKIVMTPYGYVKDNKSKIDNIIQNNKKNNNCTKIMIGHSAYPFLNHVEIMQKLEKYKEEDIKISLVLAYGDEEYSNYVISEAKRIFGNDKIEIIEKMMSQEEYTKYLTTIDICCLDYKHQAALANTYMLLYMGKKLFLNEDGILKLFTTLENIETYNISDIDRINFKEFKKVVKNAKFGKEFAQFYIDENNYLLLWKNTISSLEK